MVQGGRASGRNGEWAKRRVGETAKRRNGETALSAFDTPIRPHGIIWLRRNDPPHDLFPRGTSEDIGADPRCTLYWLAKTCQSLGTAFRGYVDVPILEDKKIGTHHRQSGEWIMQMIGGDHSQFPPSQNLVVK